LGLEGQEEQEAMAERIIAEGLSVRSTEEIVALGRKQYGSQRVSSPRGPRLPSEREREMSAQLSDHFDTRVKVDIGRQPQSAGEHPHPVARSAANRQGQVGDDHQNLRPGCSGR